MGHGQLRSDRTPPACRTGPASAGARDAILEVGQCRHAEGVRAKDTESRAKLEWSFTTGADLRALPPAKAR